ncbi:MAG: IclR family transcriptional regulator [Candidatus Atribacteria bacterium]
MEKKIIQSIDRALQVLDLFSLEKPEWGVTEISKALNICKSNVHNVLSTLSERGFVKKDPKTEKYKLGIKFFELGSVVIKNMDLRRIAYPYIEKLSKEFNETVHLGILDEGRVVSIEQEESGKSLCSRIEIGKRTPLHCTAIGKAIMAYLSKEEIASIVKEKGLKKYTENTITDKEKLEKEFKKIRKQGYAVDNMEHEEGVRCVAGSIQDYTGEVIASMSVSGPAFRINESNIPDIAKKVKRYCNCISEEMGYNFNQNKY